jgi:hypothetical protein
MLAGRSAVIFSRPHVGQRRRAGAIVHDRMPAGVVAALEVDATDSLANVRVVTDVAVKLPSCAPESVH